jgi:hypothetical protein
VLRPGQRRGGRTISYIAFLISDASTPHAFVAQREDAY